MLITVILLFIIIPNSILPPDIIALGTALILLLISRLDIKKIVEDLEMDLYLYLLGVFIVAGSLEYTGILKEIGTFITKISGGNYFATILLILWVSAVLSSTIDNIPITKVLILLLIPSFYNSLELIPKKLIIA